MTDAALPSRLPWAERLTAWLPWLLFALVVALLGFRLQLVFVANVNWDEFLYLSKVHAHLRGELASSVQSFQVHLFGWLANVSDNEVEQVVAARLAIFALSLGSAGLLYLIGRRFLSASGALFALLCYQGFSNVVDHGASFRADPICAFLLLVAVALLLMPRRPLWAAPAAGLAIAVTLLVSIKALLYLPLIAAVFLSLAWPAEGRARGLRDAAVFLAALALAVGGLFALHAAALPDAAQTDTVGFAGQSASKMFLSGAFFPRWLFFLRSLLKDPVAWLAMAAGAAFAVSLVLERAPAKRAEGLLLLGFLTPLLVLPLYRNAFPYFYVFILAPGILLAGVAFDRLVAAGKERGAQLPAIVALACAAVILAGLVGRGALLKADETGAQRQLVEAVHQVFPEPVPYIDWAGMIGRYPKLGFFMSSWGLESYWAYGRPIFREIIVAQRPLFLITDVRALDLTRPWGQARVGDGYRLLKRDHDLLAANYVPHWGPIWVVGKSLALFSQWETEFEILIPGPYRLEAADPIRIDGVLYEPGAEVSLTIGRHRAKASLDGTVVLRWAAARSGPEQAPLDEPVYRGF